MSFSLQRSGDLRWLEPEGFRREGVLAALSTREGGVSKGAYASLNLGFSSGDDPDLVSENRRRFFQALGIQTEEVVVADQVHGGRVMEVSSDLRGRGATDRRDTVGEADALATGSKRTFLFQIYADCVPIFVADPVRRAAGVAHSGWRGTAAGVGEALVAHLHQVHGSRPEDLLVAIGAAIAPPYYPVGEEVRRAIVSRYPWAEPDLAGGQADLRAVIRGALERIGVPTERIQTSDLVTVAAEDLLFSYRRDGPKSGRMGGVIGFLA